MPCDVTFDAYHGTGPACMTTQRVRARKAHSCGECGDTISPGDIYERTTGVWDGRGDTLKTCQPCVEIRDAFADGGWTYSELWDSMEVVLDTMAERGPWDCLAKVEGSARAKLQQQYESYRQRYCVRR